MKFKELIGKKILGIYLNNNKDDVVFETSEGIFEYGAYGDCCSWFEHFEGIEALIGNVVNEIEDKKIPECSETEHKEKGYDDLKQYGWTFKTNKGRATIEMRNDSNGYYSGYVSEAKEIDDEVFRDKEDYYMNNVKKIDSDF